VEKLSVTEELDRALDQVFPPAMPGGILIHRRYARHFPPMLMLRRHLFEVFANLLLNAREALNGKGNIVGHRRMSRGLFRRISIQDDVPGLPRTS